MPERKTEWSAMRTETEEALSNAQYDSHYKVSSVQEVPEM